MWILAKLTVSPHPLLVRDPQILKLNKMVGPDTASYAFPMLFLAPAFTEVTTQRAMESASVRFYLFFFLPITCITLYFFLSEFKTLSSQKRLNNVTALKKRDGNPIYYEIPVFTKFPYFLFLTWLSKIRNQEFRHYI